MNLLSRLGKGSENHSIQNFIPGEPMFTLTKGHHHAVAQPIPIQDTRPMEKKQNGLGIGATGDVAYTLDTTGAQGVAQPIAMRESGPGFWMEDTKAGTLRAEGENRPSRPSHVIGEPVISPTITTCKGSKGGSSSEAIDELIAIHDAQNPTFWMASDQANAEILIDKAGTLNCNCGQRGGIINEPIANTVTTKVWHYPEKHSVMSEEPITFQPGNLRRQAGAAPSTEVFPTLKCDSGDQSPHIAYTENPECAAFKSGQGAASRSIGYSETVSPTLAANAGGNTTPAVMAPTLTASNDPSRSPQSSEVTAQVNSVHQVTMAVRRLTPRECERLQGFPDDWSQIPWKGKPASECPDGPRYKACGNSMAVPCMRWIGEGIDKKHKELFG